MSVSGIEAVPAAGLSNLVTAAPAGQSEDKDMFLQLLVAQLRYQDPMNPADSGEFLAQSAQFTALEKMQAVADQTTLVLGAQMAFGASSMIGQQVTYTGADGASTTGTVRGVTFEAAGPVLDVDGVDVPLVSVITVGEASPTPAPSTTD
ncbi:flagellar hook capping FlgD N-terminal domain-containing protein [Nocardioides dongkuii]|uniref:flagellar hook capping FlgD N-terminal domain-containing protein n=1 Tax=Nocardioides dongkuii TaxID=2760089 RepID=UPI0015FA8834|nr:flagellar hook capping FlgD N-terminal domain-containing protein [Nocardioides dongkuii]